MITVGYIHPGMVHNVFMDSLFMFSKQSDICDGYVGAECAYIPDARNKVCEAFLKTNSEYLLFVDYDIQFLPEHPKMLMDVADENTIVCGTYVTRFGSDNKIRPCWMELKDGKQFMPISEFTVGKLHDLTVPALGFCLIHRKILERMKEHYASDVWHWFGHDTIDMERVGEDLTFAHRIKSLGVKIIGHGGVLLGHRKYSVLTVNDIVGDNDKSILNIGAGGQTEAPEYKGYRHYSLDINPDSRPDIVADARDLSDIKQKFDVVYSSHNLEHFEPEDAKKVLSNMRQVMRDDGYIHIRVPDIGLVMEREKEGHSLDEVVYESPSGPITGRDMIEGWHGAAGNEWMKHRNCFTAETLEAMIRECGFHDVKIERNNFEITAIAR